MEQVAAPAPALWSAKLQAFSIHFGLSVLAVGAVCAVTLGVWYPSGLADLQGVWKILGILVGVDVVLGPSLTYVVFAPGKRTLKFDLSVIALIQIAALAYGTWVISTQRPAYLAFMYDRFFVVAERDLLGKAPEEIANLPGWHGGPRPIFVKLSFGAQQEAAAATSSVDTPAMALLPGAYAPLRDHADRLAMFDRTGTGAEGGTLRLPVVGRTGLGHAIVDRSGDIVDIVAGDP